MANNYRQFSEILTLNSDEEVKWCKHYLESEHYNEVLEEDMPLDFQWEISGNELWIYANEFGDLEQVAEFVHKYLLEFNKDEFWSLTFSETCSKPRIGEFSGGAIFVDKDGWEYHSAYQWVREQEQKFKDSRNKLSSKD